MQLCKRLIITSSLLAVLAISSAYGATPVHSESTDTAVVEMDYSSIPELKKIYRKRNTSYSTIYLDASRGKSY